MNTSNSTSPLSVNDVLGGLPETACFTPFGIIDLLNPKASDIKIGAIARALSSTPRFNGLTGDKDYYFYTVAQHCVLGANVMYDTTKDKELALRFLLHDAHEAFLGDITRPFQKCFGSDFSNRLETIKSKWDAVIYQKFGLTPPSAFEKTYLIRIMDNLILAYEAQRFFPKTVEKYPYRWEVDSPVELFNKPSVEHTMSILLHEIWSFDLATDKFIKAYRFLNYL